MNLQLDWDEDVLEQLEREHHFWAVSGQVLQYDKEETVNSIDFWLQLPEVLALKDVPAGPEAHHPEGSAYEHTRLVLLRFLELASGLSSAMQQWGLAAAALHDVGKAKTDPSKWPLHHGHHEESEKIAEEVCARFDWMGPAEVSFIKTVCHYHHSMHRAKELTDKAWRRIFRALNWDEALVGLFIYTCEADHSGRGGKPKPYPEARLAWEKYYQLSKEPR